jgi:hypothetical protein
MRIRKGIVVFVAYTWAALAQATSLPPSPAGIEPETVEALLDRDAPPATRDRAMQSLVASAQAGDGYAAFYLGALYRHGMDHPARRVERDVETARFWLEKCVASPRCPLVALASLAELELAAGNAKSAMQWGQAWVVLDRELEKRTRGPRPHDNTIDIPFRHTAYHAYLLDRCYKAMAPARDAESLGRTWFDELARTHGPQLDRMLFTALDEQSSGGSEGEGRPHLQIATDAQRTKTMGGDVRIPIGPSLGYFLYRGSPAGGRADGVWMIEALPNPAGARGLEAQARGVRTRPYTLAADGRRAYAYLPLTFNDGAYSLTPQR